MATLLSTKATAQLKDSIAEVEDLGYTDTSSSDKMKLILAHYNMVGQLEIAKSLEKIATVIKDLERRVEEQL